jgi:pimeloyl-ACP methyl ester carboxylesterase
MQSNRVRAVVMTVAAFALAFGVVLTLMSSGGGSVIGGGGPKLVRPYLEIREVHHTELTERMRAPGRPGHAKPPSGVEEIIYRSGDLQLKAWLALPPHAPADGIPAIVYLHGGFALGEDDFKQCTPFLDAGYAVLLPIFRGENDNPGDFELMYGEVDDARAATAWLAQHPRIASGRIHAFGHSVGGGVAALLALWDNVPLRATGSAGGLFPYAVFASWSEMLPFNRRVPLERQLRLLLGNTADMKLPHYAYVGDGDDLKSVIGPAEEELKTTRAPLSIALVEGDHKTCLAPALRRFLLDIESRK